MSLQQKQRLSYLEGTDWFAADYRDESNPASTSHAGNPAYNGLNVYGDEVSANIKGVAGKIPGFPPALAALGPNVSVRRTGYTDNDLMDNER